MELKRERKALKPDIQFVDLSGLHCLILQVGPRQLFFARRRDIHTFLSFLLSIFLSYIRDLHLYLHLASILYVCHSLYASLPVSSSRFSFSSESLYVCSLRLLYLFSSVYIASTYY